MQRVLLAILCLMIQVTGCSYRFTNTHIKRPGNIKTVAIEAIYDTSRQVLPHEILWEELQKAFIADGKLHLASTSRADAVVRAHITSADFIGGRLDVTGRSINIDPEIKDLTEAARSEVYKEFPKLTQAGEFTLEDHMRYTARIEVIDLRSKHILMNKTYTFQRLVRTSRGGNDPAGFFLVYEEAKQNRFREISRVISQQVVQDLLISY